MHKLWYHAVNYASGQLEFTGGIVMDTPAAPLVC